MHVTLPRVGCEAKHGKHAQIGCKGWKACIVGSLTKGSKFSVGIIISHLMKTTMHPCMDAKDAKLIDCFGTSNQMRSSKFSYVFFGTVKLLAVGSALHLSCFATEGNFATYPLRSIGKVALQSRKLASFAFFAKHRICILCIRRMHVTFGRMESHLRLQRMHALIRRKKARSSKENVAK